MRTTLLGIAGLIAMLSLSAPRALADDAKKEDGSDKKEKAFEEAIEGFTKIEGLFTFYQKAEEGKFLMEVAPDQLGVVYLCDVARDAGDGMYFDSGEMSYSFPFVLEKVNDTLRLVHENVYYRADEDAPIRRAIDRGLTDSILGSAKIESAPHKKQKSWLIDPSGFFVKDHLAVAKALNADPASKLDYAFDKDLSRLGWVKAFPRNCEIEMVAHFTSSQPLATNMRIPDARSMEHHYRFSLSAIPQSDYVPRYADDRVGHFLTLFQDYTSLERESPYTWYVNRWHLKKANPQASVSKPEEPITFWVENTVPHEYRAAVRDGALLWNQAFELLGFEDAVVVKQMPDDADWDPADIRYNVIRWIVMPGGGYAVGPSSANPYTGEIYAADIRISADYVRYMYLQYEDLVNPLSAYADVASLDAPPVAASACNYGSAKALEVGFGADLLAARGFVDLQSEEFRRYVNEAIVDLVAHEVGHTLGLRHNFHASTLHDLEDLHDREATRSKGLTGSVMDYTPVNLAPRGLAQGDYFHTTLGVYDKWAIAYAYTPIDGDPDSQMEQLEAIASRAPDPDLAYGTDEDAFGYSPQGIDPTINLWDLGSDPIGFYEGRLTLAKELLASIETTFARDGVGYQKHRAVFGRAMRNYYLAAGTVPKYLGGYHHHRHHVGDEGASLPFEPVPAGEQRRALAFLTTHIFAPDAFVIPASLANKLAPERLYDFDWSIGYAPRVDYPLHDLVNGIQSNALARIYHPITLNRMLDAPLHVATGGDALTMYEVFVAVRRAIWSELDTGAPITSFRRNLQRSHLERLVSLVVDPQGAPYFSPTSGRNPAGQTSPPEDARSFARADLVALREGIDAARQRGLDPQVAAHLDETRARIEAVLQASVNRDL